MPRPDVAEHIPIKPLRLILGVIACIGIVTILFTLLFGFTTIPANSVGVKTRFGAYHDIVNPGLAYAIPYFDEIHIVPTQRLQKLEFGFSTPGAMNMYQGDPQPEETETMITGDLNTALVPWVVQYRITDPKMYLFGAREPEKTLRDLSESVMREVIGDRTVDEVLTIGRHDIETSTLKRLADLCSEYDNSPVCARRRRFRRHSMMSIRRNRKSKPRSTRHGPYTTMLFRTRAARQKSARNRPKRTRFVA
jgi:membrane protease subunit HflK